MHSDVQLIIAGLAGGGLTAVLALGLIVEHRSSGLLNLAHGANAMVAALFFLNSVGSWGWPIWLGFVVSVALAALVGGLFQFVVVRPLRDAPTLARLVSTLGLMLLLTSAFALIYGYGLQPSVQIFSSGVYHLPFGDPQFVISRDRFWYFVIAIVLTVVMWAIYRFTAFGRATRAAADSTRSAEILGYSSQHLELANWLIGGTLAGLAGILLATIIPPDIYSYNSLLLVSIAVALLAKFQSFAVMLVSAVVISCGQALLLKHGPDLERVTHLSGWGTALPLLVIIGVVLARGRGLAARGRPLERSLPDVPRPVNLRRWLPALLVVGVGWLLIAPTRFVDATNGTLILTLLALSVVLLTGYAGQVSLAQLSISGFGGWAAAKVLGQTNLPFPVPLVIAGAAAAGFAVLIGAPALRLRGLNLAVVTLGAAMVMDAMFFSDRAIAGADSGLPMPAARFLGVDLNGVTSARSFGIMLVVVVLIAIIAMAALRRSSLGERMLAIRANERGAAAVGISVARTKLIAFALSGVLAGVAGALQGYRSTHLSWSAFEFNQSILIVAYAYLGGLTLLSGAFVAGLITNGGIFTELFRAQGTAGEIINLIGGLGVIIMVLRHPSGLAGVGETVRAFVRRRRLRPVPEEPPPPLAEVDEVRPPAAGRTGGAS